MIFERKKKVLSLDYVNSEGENSIWPYLIINKFKIFTISLSLCSFNNNCSLFRKKAKVNYRFDKKFKVKYKNLDGKISNRYFFFFARKLSICEYSSITKACDKLLKSKKIYKFYKIKKLISFTLKIDEFANLILIDLKKGSKQLVDYIGKKETIANYFLVKL